MRVVASSKGLSRAARLRRAIFRLPLYRSDVRSMHSRDSDRTVELGTYDCRVVYFSRTRPTGLNGTLVKA